MSVTMLGERKAPPEILSALHEIDPNADLIHLGGTRWWLGVRAPNPTAKRYLEQAVAKTSSLAEIADAAERAIVSEQLGREVVMYQIMADGFRPIDLYEVEELADHWKIVEDFRIRDFHLRHQSEAEVRRQLRQSVSMDRANERRIQRWAGLAKEAASEAFRFVFRGARSVTVDAQLE